MKEDLVQETIVRQFGRPTGLLGRVAGMIMEKRPSNRERNQRTLDLLEIAPRERVLEIGFGPGYALTRALELAAEGQVIGVDHSAVMLDRAAHRNAEAIQEGRLTLCLGRAESLPLPAASLDKAYAVNVIFFWNDPVAVLRRVRAALVPGGRVAITQQPRKPGATDADTRRGAEKVKDALVAAGFTDVRIEVLPMEPVSAACVLATRPE